MTDEYKIIKDASIKYLPIIKMMEACAKTGEFEEVDKLFTQALEITSALIDTYPDKFAAYVPYCHSYITYFDTILSEDANLSTFKKAFAQCATMISRSILVIGKGLQDEDITGEFVLTILRHFWELGKNVTSLIPYPSDGDKKLFEYTPRDILIYCASVREAAVPGSNIVKVVKERIYNEYPNDAKFLYDLPDKYSKEKVKKHAENVLEKLNKTIEVINDDDLDFDDFVDIIKEKFKEFEIAIKKHNDKLCGKYICEIGARIWAYRGNNIPYENANELQEMILKLSYVARKNGNTRCSDDLLIIATSFACHNYANRIHTEEFSNCFMKLYGFLEEAFIRNNTKHKTNVLHAVYSFKQVCSIDKSDENYIYLEDLCKAMDKQTDLARNVTAKNSFKTLLKTVVMDYQKVHNIQLKWKDNSHEDYFDTLIKPKIHVEASDLARYRKRMLGVSTFSTVSVIVLISILLPEFDLWQYDRFWNMLISVLVTPISIGILTAIFVSLGKKIFVPKLKPFYDDENNHLLPIVTSILYASGCWLVYMIECFDGFWSFLGLLLSIIVTLIVLTLFIIGSFENEIKYSDVKLKWPLNLFGEFMINSIIIAIAIYVYLIYIF